MATQITHTVDPETKHLIQIVSPDELRRVLDADGSSYERPDDFGPDDEWDTGESPEPPAEVREAWEAENHERAKLYGE